MSDQDTSRTVDAGASGLDAAENLKAEHAEIKRKRGRPRKDGSAGATASAQHLPAGAVSLWRPETAKTLLVCEGLLESGISGFSGFEYSAEQADFLSPLLADVLNDLLPYDAGWVKLAAFFAGIVGIKSYQFQAWRAAKKAAADKKIGEKPAAS